MKTVSVYDAIGMVLAHDMTQIIVGKYKGSRFRKGHVVCEEDIPVLLEMGKVNIFVLELKDNDVHEDEAAMRIAKAAAGIGIGLIAKNEGKVELVAKHNGLLQIDIDKLMELIDADEIIFATLHRNQMVKCGQVVGGTRIIPLFISDDIVSKAEAVCEDSPIMKVAELKPFKIGIVTKKGN